MFYYVLCATPCAVKINGNYVGIADENMNFFDLDKAFLEFIPLDSTFLPVNYFVSNTNSNSYQNVQIIDLYGGFLIIPHFVKRASSDFKMIGRKRFDFSHPTFVTCFSQCGVKLCVTVNDEILVESIPFLPEDIRFERAVCDGKEYLVAICVGKRTFLIGFCLTNGISVVFRSLCDGYGFEKNKLSTLENVHDVLLHSISSIWEFSNQVKLLNYSVTRKKQVFTLNEHLLPYAFFEEIAINGDCSDFLSPRLKPRAKELKSFLGDFQKILPPPHFKPDDYLTLLYKDKVEYAKLTIVNSLIDNVSLDTLQ